MSNTIQKNYDQLKAILSVVSFSFAILFGIAGFCCPPLSIIDSSVLYFTGQIFLFSATLLGINIDFRNLKNYPANKAAEVANVVSDDEE